VVPAVHSDLVPGRGDLGGQPRCRRHHRAQHEERRADVPPCEQVQEARRRPGIGAVVERERDVPGIAVAREPAEQGAADRAEGGNARTALGDG
jgi:hypothetical protein